VSSKLKIGYSFWGFLGDYKMDDHGEEVSSPDGCASYAWSIVWEAVRRGHTVVPLQEFRDLHATRRLGIEKNFSSFSPEKRREVYAHLMKEVDGRGMYDLNQMWDVDVVLLEWRWPIPGKNIKFCAPTPDLGDPTTDGWYVPDDYQQDWIRQKHILEVCQELEIPVIIWDLDHKLTKDEERRWHPDAIFESSQKPRAQHIVRTQIEFPFVADDFLQHPTLMADKKRKLVYIGNNYERNDVIDQYVAPVARRNPGEVEFWGKWEEKDRRWPEISYHGRIAMRDFRQAYGTAVACPILAKRSYFQTGFTTPRPWEALLFGTLPIGFEEHLGISRYVSVVANCHDDLWFWARDMSDMTFDERDIARQELAHKLRFVDASHFIDAVERVL
jgi:hypothetical protein